MIHKTDHTAYFNDLDLSSFNDMKTSLNEPTGDFFYDPWIIKSEYKETVWEEILDSLDIDKGEARIINLEYGKCYMSHSDIDDRYHLNLQGLNSFLIDLDTQTMYPTLCDKIWYEMDTGKRHSAVNFGDVNRYQLVVRKLLQKNNLVDPVKIKFTIKNPVFNLRYIFDNTVSVWLNQANKAGVITDFQRSSETEICLIIEQDKIQELQDVLPKEIGIIQI